MTLWLYFKLFNNIKSPHEARTFARLELESLVGAVEVVPNFIPEFSRAPLEEFLDATFEGKGNVRVVDSFTYELPYGDCQGYRTELKRIEDISRLARRLAYTREIFAITSGKNSDAVAKKLFPDGQKGMNVLVARAGDFTLVRIVTHQYYLESSEYISKLSRDEAEIDANVERLMRFPSEKLYRIPASSTMRIGKRLEDWFAIREEPSLYLVHYMYPYKGKFHPKMVRALLNYTHPGDNGLVMDNYAGSGTLLVEANLLGLDSVGVEINPMSALTSQVKCDSLRIIEPERLKSIIKEFLSSIPTWLESIERGSPPVDAFDPSSFKIFRKAIKNDAKRALSELNTRKKYFSSMNQNHTALLVTKHLIEKNIEGEEYKRFFLLALAGSISDFVRRRTASHLEILTERLGDLYLRVYLFHRLNKYLKIDVGMGTCHTGDTRDLKSLHIPPVDANVNSPPYSTALDYIENDQPQLSILGLHPDLDQLVKDMIGFPRKNYDEAQLAVEIEGNLHPFSDLSETARNIIKGLYKRGRTDAALRSYKFFIDTNKTISEVHSVLKPGAKYAIVIGNNWFKTLNSEDVEEENEEIDYPSIYDDLQDEEFDYRNIPVETASHICVKNDQVYIELGQRVGFRLDIVITRVLQKSSVGNIRYESIVVLEKKA